MIIKLKAIKLAHVVKKIVILKCKKGNLNINRVCSIIGVVANRNLRSFIQYASCKYEDDG